MQSPFIRAITSEFITFLNKKYYLFGLLLVITGTVTTIFYAQSLFTLHPIQRIQ